MPFTFTKDPDDIESFTIDYSTNYLDTNETIAGSVWTVIDSGITVESSSTTSNTASCFISGGTSGNSYQLRNRITTSAGRQKDITGKITVFAQ